MTKQIDGHLTSTPKRVVWTFGGAWMGVTLLFALVLVSCQQTEDTMKRRDQIEWRDLWALDLTAVDSTAADSTLADTLAVVDTTALAEAVPPQEFEQVSETPRVARAEAAALLDTALVDGLPEHLARDLTALKALLEDSSLFRVAAADSNVPEVKYPRLEIDGLVVDETISKMGRDFYDLFYTFWEAPPEAFNYTVVVTEQPSPNLGTRVQVKVNDDIAFQSFLQPRYEIIEATAQQGVYWTRRMVENLQPRPLYL